MTEESCLRFVNNRKELLVILHLFPAGGNNTAYKGHKAILKIISHLLAQYRGLHDVFLHMCCVLEVTWEVGFLVETARIVNIFPKSFISSCDVQQKWQNDKLSLTACSI